MVHVYHYAAPTVHEEHVALQCSKVNVNGPFSSASTFVPPIFTVVQLKEKKRGSLTTVLADACALSSGASFAGGTS